MGSLHWEVSALGFGCMRLPQRRINRLRAETDESVKIIRSGIDQGINYLDTAWPYHLGDSEKILGYALKDGYREQVKLVTKLATFLVRNTNDYDSYLETQLKRLQTYYLDIYLFHALDRRQFDKVKRLGLFEKMEKAKEEGLINHIGFSFHDTLPVFKEIIDFYDWDMAQIQYNYMDTGIQATTEGLRYAYSKNIAVVIREPLKGGKLVNPPKEALDIMKASGINRTPVDWALQFLWNKPEISTVLSGMGSQQMVDENCKSADIYREKIFVSCTACNYCMPCPVGVDIPGNFALLNYLSKEASWIQRFQIRRKYNGMTNKPDKVDPNKPNGKASLCINCGKCLENCPQHIQVPDELKKVDAILGKGKKITDYY